jgi:hypothetical protein
MGGKSGGNDQNELFRHAIPNTTVCYVIISHFIYFLNAAFYVDVSAFYPRVAFALLWLSHVVQKDIKDWKCILGVTKSF